MTHASLTLVLGGIASGKSAWAEARAIATGLPRLYLATSQALDDEMQAKIARHRDQRGPDWTTIEAPLDAATALRTAPPGHVVLFDCATMWLTNHLLAGHDLAEQTTALLAALSACACPVIVVSNEIGLAGVPENALARHFANEQGRLNQALAQQAQSVVLIAAGLPIQLKDTR